MTWPLGDNSDPQRHALFQELDAARRDAQYKWIDFEAARKPAVEAHETGKTVDKQTLAKMEGAHQLYKSASAAKQTAEDAYHLYLEKVHWWATSLAPRSGIASLPALPLPRLDWAILLGLNYSRPT